MKDNISDNQCIIQCTLLHIKGRVQGVGFRPYIFRLANNYNLKGYVLNRPDGVIILIQGEPENIDTFIGSKRDQQ
jgi:hydrogenase maturation protein HypF